VLVTAAREAERIAALSAGDLAQEIERRSHSILGKIDPQAGHGLFPLSIERARRFGDRRVALIGEAAHLIPPIGAQGLNLGLRDAATIAELVIAARRDGADVGAADLLVRYDAARRMDVGSRTLAVDFLHRSLLSDFLPMQAARGLALYLLDHIGPLRRAMMREGVAPATAPLRLMRGEKL
jgi:2-octaprenyl-6-methoxyphenol hydroxylase